MKNIAASASPLRCVGALLYEELLVHNPEPFARVLTRLRQPRRRGGEMGVDTSYSHKPIKVNVIVLVKHSSDRGKRVFTTSAIRGMLA